MELWARVAGPFADALRRTNDKAPVIGFAPVVGLSVPALVIVNSRRHLDARRDLPSGLDVIRPACSTAVVVGQSPWRPIRYCNELSELLNAIGERHMGANTYRIRHRSTSRSRRNCDRSQHAIERRDGCILQGSGCARRRC